MSGRARARFPMPCPTFRRYLLRHYTKASPSFITRLAPKISTLFNDSQQSIQIGDECGDEGTAW